LTTAAQPGKKIRPAQNKLNRPAIRGDEVFKLTIASKNSQTSKWQAKVALIFKKFPQLADCVAAARSAIREKR